MKIIRIDTNRVNKLVKIQEKKDRLHKKELNEVDRSEFRKKELN
jgi:hypothetical protein